MPPSTSASRRPTSSCCPSPTAISRRLPPPGSTDADVLPTLRLASLKRLRHPMSVDLYVESVVARARMRHRALPGRARLLALRLRAHRRHRARRRHRCSPPCRATIAPIRGSPRSRPSPPSRWRPLDRFFREGGAGESAAGAALCRRRCSAATSPGRRRCRSARSRRARAIAPSQARPVALVVFYRANLMAADTAPITALMEALERQGLAPLAVAVNSLKDPAGRARAEGADRGPQARDHPQHHGFLGACARTTRRCSTPPTCRCCRSCCRAARARRGQISTRGLSPADLAMNVVLPELDGRLLTRAISFKAEAPTDPRLEFAGVHHEPAADRIDYVARLAAAWARLGPKPRARAAIWRWSCPTIRRAAAAPAMPSASTRRRAPPRSCSCSRAEGYDTGAQATGSRMSDCRAPADRSRCRCRLSAFAATTLPPSLQRAAGRDLGRAG